MKTLKPSEAYEFIVDCLMDTPPSIPYAAGPAAIGKSDLYADVARDHNLKLVPEFLSNRAPEDLTGLPRFNPDTGKAEYVPFGNFPLVGDPLPINEHGEEYDGWLILLDEIPNCSDDVLSAIYPILLGHSVGGHAIHPKARICGAGNRASDNALARELPETIITRVLPFQMTVSAADWLVWANNLPANRKNEKVIAFIEKNTPMLYNTADHADRSELQTFGTPRGWAKMMSIVNLHEKRMAKIAVDLGKDPTESSPLTAGVRSRAESAVGTMEQRAFTEFYEESIKIPYAWDISQAPSAATVPPTTIGKAQVTSSLATYYSENLASKTACDNILQYMNRLPSENAAVFASMLMEMLPQTSGTKEKLAHVVKVLGVSIIPA
jgi:hypothetical protein